MEINFILLGFYTTWVTLTHDGSSIKINNNFFNICFILFQKNKKFCIYFVNSVIISAIGKFSTTDRILFEIFEAKKLIKKLRREVT